MEDRAKVLKERPTIFTALQRTEQLYDQLSNTRDRLTDVMYVLHNPQGQGNRPEPGPEPSMTVPGEPGTMVDEFDKNLNMCTGVVNSLNTLINEIEEIIR